MQLQLQELVGMCMVCDRVWASFNAPHASFATIAYYGVGL